MAPRRGDRHSRECATGRIVALKNSSGVWEYGRRARRLRANNGGSENTCGDFCRGTRRSCRRAGHDQHVGQWRGARAESKWARHVLLGRLAGVLAVLVLLVVMRRVNIFDVTNRDHAGTEDQRQPSLVVDHGHEAGGYCGAIEQRGQQQERDPGPSPSMPPKPHPHGARLYSALFLQCQHPEQHWDTTINPTTRRPMQVRIEDTNYLPGLILRCPSETPIFGGLHLGDRHKFTWLTDAQRCLRR
jgi:hypothetical protein